MNLSRELEALRDHIQLTWRLVKQAEGEGNLALARELMRIAREADDELADDELALAG